MTIETLMQGRRPARSTVVTVGTFDGVHAGHRKLLGEVAESARRRAMASVAITFKQQPRAVLQPGRPTAYLCSLAQRIELIEAAGIETVIPVDFDDSVRQLSAREFAAMLGESLGMRSLVLGVGATIGRNREGDESTLRKLGSELGFEFRAVESVILDGQVVSSTAIRHALAKGQIEGATQMLGRPYGLSGTVETGDHRGRTLGFPTANLNLDQNPFQPVVPSDGVYATIAVTDDGRRHMSATSIGVRPTFGGNVRTVETYLIDFDGDLYDRTLALEFRARLRDELKFGSADELVGQMHRDVETARSILSDEVRGGARSAR